jgi:hypothetical protein
MDIDTQPWIAAATKIFQDFDFVLTTGWWKHQRSGFYAGLDDPSLGHGRAAALYAHRMDSAGTDYMQALVTIPWYDDGADFETSQRLLKNALSTVTR